MSDWHPALRATVDQCFAAIESDPRFLLEADGGPHGVKADVVIARLFGHDEQLDHEWRIPEVRDVLLAPKMPRPTLARDVDPIPNVAFSVARYNLRSNYAVALVSREWLPDEPFDMTQNAVRVLCLRYVRGVET